MINNIMIKMINYLNGNLHDINHFLKVHSFAKIIGEKENLNEHDLKVLEISAVIHDIACPLCRQKYGNTNHKFQEEEGMILAKEFLKDEGLAQEELDRIIYLVGHHHTLNEIEGIDYQILIEADYLVNAYEAHYSLDNQKNFISQYFKTKTGIELAKSMYQL